MGGEIWRGKALFSIYNDFLFMMDRESGHWYSSRVAICAVNGAATPNHRISDRNCTSILKNA
jgi:hypothetical protein